jgi:7-carboxy-7-deazaguanine synthase
MNDLYPVNDLYACIQGEGVQTGMPMALLRLHGCEVGCPWCDTKETWDFEPENIVSTIREALGTSPRYTMQTAEAIAATIADEYPALEWVLVTGGEPARQPLASLVAALHQQGKRVALETSGTETGHVGAGFDWVCVSPKIAMPGGKTLQPEALAVADEIKMVVGRQRDIERLDLLIGSSALKQGVTISLQPLSGSDKAIGLCVETVQARGWRLSIQTHKLIAQR